MPAEYRRGIYLYINGKEVKNDIKSIKAEMSRLVNEQARMTIGSKEYIAQSQKIKAVPRLKAEFMDLSNEENEEILEFLREKAVCKSEEAHGILEISFQIVPDIAI